MTKDDWTTVRIPRKLHEKIKELISESDFGYRTVSGFINAAVHERLIELGVFIYLQPPEDENGEDKK